MAHLSRVASLALLAYMFPLTWADILPTSGKYVPYKVEVTSMPESTDMKLVIFPWGESNGRPEADIKFIEPLTPVYFGRRVAGGRPKFWAVHADAKVLSELNDLRRASEAIEDIEAIEDWLKKQTNAVSCKGPVIDPRFLAESGEEEFLDKFAVVSMNADRCEVRKSEGVDVENKDNLGSYAEPEAGSRSESISLGSWGFSIIALGALCGLVWRLSSALRNTSSSALRNTSGQSVGVQE